MLIECFFDGACEPYNPGGTASYGIIVRKGNEILHSEAGLLPDQRNTTNNVAEYYALSVILSFLLSSKLQDEKIIVKGDSRLVINQMFGTWQIHNGAYVPLALSCKEMLKSFPMINGRWIPREENVEADNLSVTALEKVGIKRIDRNNGKRRYN